MIDNPTTTKPSLQRVAKFLSLVLILLIAISLMGMQPAKIVDAEAKIQAEPVWTAYNDLVYRSGQPSTNITQYTIPDEGTSTGFLKNYADGSNTPVTVTIMESGVQGLSGGDAYDGSEANSGTDAYDTFHGKVDSTGLIVYGSDSTWYVDLTFTGLTAGKTYTFATTANRNNDESDYISRVSKFTISDVDSATNASTTGVTVISNTEVAFSTGYNTVSGYVARWTGIVPGEDGDFKVRVNANSGNLAYGPSVFLLQEEAAPAQKYTVTFDANGGSTPVPTTKEVTLGSPYGELATTSRTGFTFDGWFTQATGGTEVTAATTVTTASDHTLYAHWTALQYTLTIDVDPVSSGSVTRDPDTATYAYGTTVTLTPVPEAGFEFDGWTGDDADEIVDTAGVFTIVMDGDKSVTANFKSLPTIFYIYLPLILK